MLRGESNEGGDVRPVSKCKFQAKKLVYSFGSDDRDGRSSQSKKDRREHSQATAFHVVVELRSGGKDCATLDARSLDINKIDSYFVKTLVEVGHVVVFFLKHVMEALGLIFYCVIINLIYPFFIGFLIAAIRWI